MKIQYCSDLHLEFPENKKYILENPIKPKAEILILAGDIVPFAVIDKHQDFFDYVSENFRYTFWIPGNHEYYYSDINNRTGSFEEKIRDNVLLLNNTVKEIDGIRFIFSTLWSDISPERQFLIQQSLSDFKVIKNNSRLFNTDDYNLLYQENLLFLENAFKQCSSRSVVITHHVPVFENYPEQYKDSNINEAFAVDLSNLILNNSLDYWIYGHHHCNISDFNIGNTKMITNQLGYIRYEENIGYKESAVIEINKY
ncbi:metallophosphoesterase [Paenimyroides tangerinum]|uniref:Metallophosphoesterase n=1 Tax=Paenimyroides tangerinum TaxID=2488728 RepID=A0A3P3VUJ0_9FLAO|nr:metallophosphoesterase [Paenimyroides tangerinum]RRJ86350.1 metallophosphoesterase [Paenimyroides tangerinum]